MPLPIISKDERTRKIAAIIALTRAQYATPKQEVERLLFESLHIAPDTKEKPKVFVKEERKVPVEKPVSIEPVALKEIPITEPLSEPKIQKPEKDISTHRYLQTLVKKMAEASGYTAVIESVLPDGSGQVDVLLTKESKTIAVEICNTTDAEWEMHNISKCIQAKYDMVISLSGDIKQLEKIKKKCSPDALFAFLADSVKETAPQEKVMKGYRVNVSYDAVTTEEMNRKRASVAQVVMNSLKKQKKKE